MTYGLVVCRGIIWRDFSRDAKNISTYAKGRGWLSSLEVALLIAEQFSNDEIERMLFASISILGDDEIVRVSRGEESLWVSSQEVFLGRFDVGGGYVFVEYQVPKV